MNSGDLTFPFWCAGGSLKQAFSFNFSSRREFSCFAKCHCKPHYHIIMPGVWNIYMCYIYLRGYLFNVANKRRCFSSFIWNENQEETDSERLKERRIDMKRYFRARWTLRTDICQCAVYASIWFCVRRFFFNWLVNLIKKFFEADTPTFGEGFSRAFLPSDPFFSQTSIVEFNLITNRRKLKPAVY